MEHHKSTQHDINPTNKKPKEILVQCKEQNPITYPKLSLTLSHLIHMYDIISCFIVACLIHKISYNLAYINIFNLIIQENY